METCDPNIKNAIPTTVFPDSESAYLSTQSNQWLISPVSQKPWIILSGSKGSISLQWKKLNIEEREQKYEGDSLKSRDDERVGVPWVPG